MPTKFVTIVSGIPRMQTIPSSVAIYDQTYSVGSTITTGTPITLPASGTYNSAELEVYLNGQRMNVVEDYNYVGAGPTRTQVAVLFDLYAGDLLRFRVDRTA